MNIKNLLDDNAAVSPVIGVILMVAITVILAAVIGTFVLGLGDQVNNNTPQASFEYNYSVQDGGDTDSLGITHVGGDTIENTTLDVKIGGTTVYDDGSADTGAYTGSGDLTFPQSWDAELTAGDTLVVVEDSADNIAPGDEIRIIWQNPSGGSSSVISSDTVA